MANSVIQNVLVVVYCIFIIVFLFFAIIGIKFLFKILLNSANSKLPKQEKVIARSGLLIGLLYGILIRYFATSNIKFGNYDIISIMSFAFIIIVPLVIGILSVFYSRISLKLNWRGCLKQPALAASGCLILANLVLWEGLICIILFLPAFLFIAGIGGLIGGALVDIFDRKNISKQNRTLLTVNIALLPFAIGLIENFFEVPIELREVKNQIEIQASAADVWQEIASVRKIEQHEHSWYFSNQIGFPRPVEAILEETAQGRIRKASFEGGIVFTEKVDLWEPEKSLAFGIKANTDEIPATSLDPHVTIGGPYFDVLHGRYDIEVLDSRHVILHLRSEHRLTTNFNWYASFWSDFIMSDIQQYILKIIKNRAEAVN